jgi:hypothetical protein
MIPIDGYLQADRATQVGSDVTDDRRQQTNHDDGDHETRPPRPVFWGRHRRGEGCGGRGAFIQKRERQKRNKKKKPKPRKKPQQSNYLDKKKKEAQ